MWRCDYCLLGDQPAIEIEKEKETLPSTFDKYFQKFSRKVVAGEVSLPSAALTDEQALELFADDETMEILFQCVVCGPVGIKNTTVPQRHKWITNRLWRSAAAMCADYIVKEGRLQPKGFNQAQHKNLDIH